MIIKLVVACRMDPHQPQKLVLLPRQFGLKKLMLWSVLSSLAGLINLPGFTTTRLVTPHSAACVV